MIWDRFEPIHQFELRCCSPQHIVCGSNTKNYETVPFRQFCWSISIPLFLSIKEVFEPLPSNGSLARWCPILASCLHQRCVEGEDIAEDHHHGVVPGILPRQAILLGPGGAIYHSFPWKILENHHVIPSFIGKSCCKCGNILHGYTRI